MAKQDVTTELFYDGVWNSVPVRATKSPITISRGEDDQNGDPTPSRVTFSIDDQTGGKYNPKNPMSPLSGMIGRNTPCRIYVDNPSVYEDFEDATLDISVTNGGNAAWARSSAQANTGSWSFKSGSISNSQTSDAIVAVPTGARKLTFAYKVSSEDDFDDFRVLVDSTTVLDNANGEIDWTTFSVDVTGASTVTFRYAKDGDTIGGSDAAWIDNIVFEAGGRFYGEVASYTPGRSEDFVPGAGRGDAWVNVEAQGILRRLGQGEDPLPSVLRNFMDSQAGVLAYYPMEDGTDATTPSNAAPNGYTAVVNDVSFGTDDTLPASAGVMTFNSAASKFTAQIPPSSTTEFISVVMLFKLDAVPPASPVTELFRVEATGSAARMSITMDDNGFGRNVTSSTGAVLLGSEVAHQVDTTEWVAMHFGLWQSAPGTITWSFYRHQVGSGTIFGDSGTFSGTLGRATRMAINSNASLAQAKFAHWIVTNESFPFVTSGLVKVAKAYAGYENVVERLERLCDQAGIAFTSAGDATGSALAPLGTMGAQRTGTLVSQFAECQRTNDGLLFEPRAFLGLHFRTRKDLYNQDPALTLDWSAKEVMPPFQPVIDDTASRNDVTIQRVNGGSARAVLEDGPMSVQAPPDGIGRYTTQIEVNTFNDVTLPSLASWHMRKGTVDEIRYREVTVNVDVVPDAALVDIGDVIAIENLPMDISPDDALLLVLGYTEVIESHTRRITFNCMPAEAYRVGVWDETAAVTSDRWDSAYSTTSGTVTTGTTTSMSVAVESGRLLWTTTAGHFPFDINLLGARVRVTNITGTSSPQTFTISSTVVNGVNKSIPSGTPVRLWKPARYAL